MLDCEIYFLLAVKVPSVFQRCPVVSGILDINAKRRSALSPRRPDMLDVGKVRLSLDWYAFMLCFNLLL